MRVALGFWRGCVCGAVLGRASQWADASGRGTPTIDVKRYRGTSDASEVQDCLGVGFRCSTEFYSDFSNQLNQIGEFDSAFQIRIDISNQLD